MNYLHGSIHYDAVSVDVKIIEVNHAGSSDLPVGGVVLVMDYSEAKVQLETCDRYLGEVKHLEGANLEATCNSDHSIHI